MTVLELTGKMYYRQKVRIFEVDNLERLKKTCVYEGENCGLRSDIFKQLNTRTVIGFGVGCVDNTIDINI